MFQFAGDFPNAPEAIKNTHLVINARVVPLLSHKSVYVGYTTKTREPIRPMIST